MAQPRSLNQIRYGSSTELPERRVLHAGPLTAELENADLRYVKVGDVEIVRRLYFAVRDRNWGTVEPVYTRFEVDDRGDSFRIDIEAEHLDAASGVDFAWSGMIEGTTEGTIRYEMEGSPRSAFLRNRIGFCVLHPSDLAGRAGLDRYAGRTGRKLLPRADLAPSAVYRYGIHYACRRGEHDGGDPLRG